MACNDLHSQKDTTDFPAQYHNSQAWMQAVFSLKGLIRVKLYVKDLGTFKS